MSVFNDRRIFYINSRNRISGTNADFSYKLDMRGINPNRVVVLQANIPKSFYIVEDGENTFNLDEGGGNLLVTLPPGSYTRISIKVALKTALEAAGAFTYTISSPATSTEADTGLLTFTVSGNGGVQPDFIFGNYLWEQLGFDNNTTYTFATNVLTTPNVIKLIKEDSLFIHSNICKGANDNNILQEIYASSNPEFTNIVFQTPDSDLYSKVITSNQGGIYTFTLSNEDGDDIDLQGQNWNFTLCVYKQENQILNFMKEAFRIMMSA